MEWKENFGMLDAQNGMENLKKGMEDRLPYFHTNYIYSTGIYQNLQEITKYTTYKKLRSTLRTRMRMISRFSVLQCKF